MIRKRKFRRYIARRFFVRFHMSLILIGTVLSGLVFSKLLLLANLENMTLRYPVVVLAAYLCFFVFIRLWLLYIRSTDKSGSDIADPAFDAVGNADLPGSGTTSPEFGGGNFGGGGASGTFGEFDSSSLQEGPSSGIGEIAGEAGGSILEEGGIVIIPLMLILAAIFGAGIFLIYEAPVILSEAAFEFVLASALVKKAKEIDNPDWMGSVLRNTWKPFLFTLFLAIFSSVLLHHFFPGATRLSQIFM